MPVYNAKSQRAGLRRDMKIERQMVLHLICPNDSPSIRTERRSRYLSGKLKPA